MGQSPFYLPVIFLNPFLKNGLIESEFPRTVNLLPNFSCIFKVPYLNIIKKIKKKNLIPLPSLQLPNKKLVEILTIVTFLENAENFHNSDVNFLCFLGSILLNQMKR